MRVAQVVGKLAAGGVEAVVNTYYRRLDHTRIPRWKYGSFYPW